MRQVSSLFVITMNNRSALQTIQAPSCSVYDSLFTPPPSEADDAASTSDSSPPFNPRRSRIFCSPPSRKMKTVLSHVLVPPLSRPKSEYLKIPSFVTTKPIRKPRRRTPLSKKSPTDEQDVVFVTGSPTVIHLPKEPSDLGKQSFIDLTLDDDEAIKPIPLLSEPAEGITHVPKSPSPDRVLVVEETQIRVGVVYSIPYRTLLFNTRFLRCPRGDLTDPKELPVGPSLPIRRRRALVDNVLETSSSLRDEFSIGLPVVWGFERKGVYHDGCVNSEDELVELLDPASEVVTPVPDSPRGHPPAPQLELPPAPSLPKIDLAVKLRQKKTRARRPSSLLTTSVKKAAPPVQFTLSTVSRPPASSLQNAQDVVMDDASYSPHTPMVPSTKALGKRKGTESDLQPTRLSFSRLPVMTPECTDDSFDLFINYGPPSPVRATTLTSDNHAPHYFDGAAYRHPDLYPNLSLPSTTPNVTFLDRHNQPSTFSSVETAASLLYHSDDYITGPPHDFIPGLDPSPNTTFPTWPPEPETSFSYDGGTVNPSLLGGETLGIPDLYVPDVGHGFFTSEQEDQDDEMSSLSSSPKSEPPRAREGVRTFISHPAPPTTLNNMPKNENQGRRRLKRAMPDMVPLSELRFSSDSEFGVEDDEAARSIITSKQPRRSKHSNSRTKSLPTAGPLSAELNMNGRTVIVAGQPWPMQEEASYCHQCRNKTTVLKIGCESCKKLYCVRCLTTR